MRASSDEFVPLVHGPVVRREAIDLLLRFEARGIEVVAVGDDGLQLRPRGRVTQADMEAARRWRPHLLAVARYLDALTSDPGWVQ